MKRNARKAYNELKKLGVHVLGPEFEWGGDFAISAESWGDNSVGDEPDKKLDYYEDYWGERTVIPGVLQKYGMSFEWVNALSLIHI
jgi:hypothetical protein